MGPRAWRLNLKLVLLAGAAAGAVGALILAVAAMLAIPPVAAPLEYPAATRSEGLDAILPPEQAAPNGPGRTRRRAPLKRRAASSRPAPESQPDTISLATRPAGERMDDGALPASSGAEATRANRPAPRPSIQDAESDSRASHESDFAGRSATGRRRLVQRFGGNQGTEDAVERGLRWLAAHQEPSGSWDRIGFQRRCPPDARCAGVAVSRTSSSLTAGLTGLCALAFLGAGYTDREGPYRDVVARALAALRQMRRPDGGFSDEDMAGYNDSLATFALAEHYAMTRDPRDLPALDKAVTRLTLSQQPLGGWDYLPYSDAGRNDTSITAWAVQALQACAAAGLEVPPRVLVRAALHFDRATEEDGRVWYSDAGTGFRLDDLDPQFRYGPAMTAAGLAACQLLGWRGDHPLVRRQQAALLAQPPSTSLLQGRDPTQLHSYYYWYYGTVALFQLGGGSWERWNAQLRDMILPLQALDDGPDNPRRHEHGSWAPFGRGWGKWGRMGGRVYSTAICVLTLEIYYRHSPAYLLQEPVIRAADWRGYLAEASARERRACVEALRKFRLEACEPALVDALADPEPDIALAAALALAEMDNPLGAPLLTSASDASPPWIRGALERALRRLRDGAAPAHAPGVVRVYDARQRLATLELAPAFYGMPVMVLRGERPIARMRIVRRFSDRAVVVAELVESLASETPQPGDTVAAR